MKTKIKAIFIGVLIVFVTLPAVAIGGSITHSLIQGKSVPEALNTLAEQIESLTERVETIEEDQVAQELWQKKEEACKTAEELNHSVPPPPEGMGWNWRAAENYDSCEEWIEKRELPEKEPLPKEPIDGMRQEKVEGDIPESKANLEVFVSVHGGGGGTVTSNPSGIDCDDRWCSYNFDVNSSITLKAIPDDNSVFLGWGTDCDGNQSQTSITMNENKTCYATFVIEEKSKPPAYPSNRPDTLGGIKYDTVEELYLWTKTCPESPDLEVLKPAYEEYLQAKQKCDKFTTQYDSLSK